MSDMQRPKNLIVLCKKSVYFGVTKIDRLIGIKKDKNHIYKWIKYNSFSKKPSVIPEGFIKCKPSKKLNVWINNHISGNKSRPVKKTMSKHVKHSMYRTRGCDNGDNLVIYVSKTKVYVYTKQTNTFNDNSEIDKNSIKFYHKLVCDYKYDRVLLGHDHNFGFSGNSLLVQFGKEKYAFIGGSTVYEFSVTSGDYILSFLSPVSKQNKCYPVAIGNDNIYLLNRKAYIAKSKFETSADIENAYLYIDHHKKRTHKLKTTQIN